MDNKINQGRKRRDFHTNKDGVPVICQQIRYYRESKGMEQKELAAELGIKGNSICNWESGRTRPDIALLPKLSEIFNVSVDELFGLPAPLAPEPKYKSSIPVDSDSERNMLEKYRLLSSGHRLVVDSVLDKLNEVEDQELYDRVYGYTEFTKQLAAGFDEGVEFDDKGETIYLYKDKVDIRTDCIFTVNGDSMEPMFHSGDKVLVQKFPNCQELKQGDIGAFIVGNETYIKEYRKDGLHSLNKKYKTMKFSDDDKVYIIGRVVGILSAEAVVSYEDSVRYERVKQMREEQEN